MPPGRSVMTSRIDIPVGGGRLAAYRVGPEDGTPVLAIHGITSSSRTWLATARALGGQASLVAVDLRGRGQSGELPPPFGLDAHVLDMLAVLDQLGPAPAVVLGHSLGAYIAARLATTRPDRVKRLVLVDGGLTIPGTTGADPEEFMQAFLGPSLERLAQTFPDLAAYRAWWARHPAFAGADILAEDLDAYAAHDLVGKPPRMRSPVNPQAVRDDGRDLFGKLDADRLTVPATLLCAPKGMIDDPNPMQPLAAVQAWAAADPGRRRAIQVPDVNHFTIALGTHGAIQVAAAIRQAVI